MTHEKEIAAAMRSRVGADRMALGLNIIPGKTRGDMDRVEQLQAENKQQADFLSLAKEQMDVYQAELDKHRRN